MLDPWIIEEILRREEEQRREREMDRAQLPMEGPPRYRDSNEIVVTPPKSDEGERGVVVIDI